MFSCVRELVYELHLTANQIKIKQLLIKGVMDGECFKADSNFLPEKKLSDSRAHDRISELHDEIIVVILSFLSLKEAAATSILSRRWSHLWKHTLNLNFNTHILKTDTQIPREHDSWDVKSCKYVELVNSVLQSHKALFLKQFKISFYVNKSAQSQVNRWLEFVFSRRVEGLELDFLCEASDNKVVLEESLRETRRSLIFLKSLKSLCLNCLRVSGEDIKMFLHNCPSLENLKIKWATLTSNVDVCGENLMLKRLEILLCIGRKSIRIRAPNLTWIRVDDNSGTLYFENVPKLVQADFNIRRVAPHFAPAVSCFTSQLQTLHLTLCYPKVLSWDNGFPQMPKLKTLFVKDCGHHEHGGFLPVAALICASPRLHKCTLLCFGDRLEDEAAHMEVITNAERPKHQHLKIFKLELGRSCVGISDHLIKFVKYVSKNCIALRKITIGHLFQGASETRNEVEEANKEYYLKQLLRKNLPRRIRLQIS